MNLIELALGTLQSMILIDHQKNHNSRPFNKNTEGGNHGSKCNTEMD